MLVPVFADNINIKKIRQNGNVQTPASCVYIMGPGETCNLTELDKTLTRPKQLNFGAAGASGGSKPYNQQTSVSSDSGQFSLTPPTMITSVEEDPVKALRCNFVYLKCHLPTPEVLLPHLQQNNSLSGREYDEIRCLDTNLQKHEKILKTVIRKGHNVCAALLTILRHQDYNHIHNKVRQKFQESLNPDRCQLNFCLQDQHLQDHKAAIISEIDPMHISDVLFEDGHLSVDCHDEIAAKETSKHKSFCLISKFETTQEKRNNLWRAFQKCKADLKLLQILTDPRQRMDLQDMCVRCVRLSFRGLAYKISPDLMLNYLYEEEVITQAHYTLSTAIKNETVKRGKVVKLSLNAGEEACEQFLLFVKREEHIYNPALFKLQERNTNGRRQNNFNLTMNDLKSHEQDLKDEIDNAIDIADVLLEENEFRTSDHDDVVDAKRRTEKCRLLLTKLFRNPNPDSAAKSFVYALEELKSLNLLRDLAQPLPSHSGNFGGAVRVTCIDGVVQTQITGYPPNSDLTFHFDMVGQNQEIITQELFVSLTRGDPGTEGAILEHTAMEVDSTETGSVVVHLQPITDDAVQNLIEYKEETIKNMLSAIFDQAGMKELLVGKETGVKVQLRTRDKKKDQEEHIPEDEIEILKEKVVNNWDFLLDELEIQQMIPLFLKKKCFEEKSLETVFGDVVGRKEKTGQFLTWILYENPENVLMEFFNILKEMNNAYVLDRLSLVKPQNLHERAEIARKGILENYSVLLDELDSVVIRDTLKHCRNASEDIKKVTSSSGGKGRKKRVHEFLKFVLKDDQNVLEFEKVMESLELDDLMKMESASAAPPVAERSVSKESLKEGILFECKFTVTVEPEDDKPVYMKEKGKFLEKSVDSGLDLPDDSVGLIQKIKSLTIDEKFLKEKELRQRDEEHKKRLEKSKEFDEPKPPQQKESAANWDLPKPSASKVPEKPHQREGQEYKVVAAIDFGTTYSGYAYSESKDPYNIQTNKWSSKSKSKLMSSKTPTTILFDDHGQFHSFGFEAEEHYSHLTDENIHDGWSCFKKFKMKLHQNTSLSRETTLKDTQGKTKPALEVFSKSIEYLKEKVEKSLEDNGVEARREEILWVITVPAIWEEPSKQFMRIAAEQAGIIGNQLMFAFEPEAAALYMKEAKTEKSDDRLKSYDPGKKFIVVDVGGGTADFTVMEVNDDHTLKQLHRANGGDWGGNKMNESFFGVLYDAFGTDVMDEFKRDNQSEVLRLELEIETKKRSFDERRGFTLELPVTLTDLVKGRLKSDWIELIKTKGRGGVEVKRGNKVVFSGKLVKQFYMDIIEEILKKTNELFTCKTSKGVQDIILVGGFSSSILLQQEMRLKFKSQRPIIPEDADLAVLRGAVIFGHYPNMISSRICPYTYGVEGIRYFMKSDLVEKKIMIQGKPHCKHVFECLVQAGQSIGIDEEVTTQRLPSRTNMKHMEVKVYRTESKEPPPYVTTKGCSCVGKVVVDMPDTTGDLDRIVNVSLLFGKTEIIVVGKDENTGEEFKTAINFLPA